MTDVGKGMRFMLGMLIAFMLLTAAQWIMFSLAAWMSGSTF